MFKIIQRFCLVGCLLASVAGAAEDPGTLALNKAKQGQKFLIAFFSDKDSDQEKTAALKASVKAAADGLSDKIMAVFIDTGDQGQQALVKEYRLLYAPKPIALLIAGNGAVVGSFQEPMPVDKLAAGLPTPGMQNCIKELQGGKIVALCIQNKHSAQCVEAMKGVDEFIKDPRFGKYVAKVMIDPAVDAEASLLKQFQIDPTKNTAVSVLLTPPGSVVGKWEGAVTKDVMAQKLMMAMASSRGCGSGSCVDPSCKTPPKGAQQ